MSQTSPSVARGVALLHLGRAQEAEQLFRDALASEPSDDDALAHLAHALLAQDRYADARTNAANALRLDPLKLNALTALAAAHAGMGDCPRALDAITQAQALAPEFGGVHRHAGAILSMQGRHGEAVAAVERAVDLDPEDSIAWSTMARVLMRAGRRSEAETALAQALQLDPQNIDAHQAQSVWQLERGGGGGAVSTSREALRLDPKDPANREIHALARKSRNPLFGLLLRFSFFLESKPPGVRRALIFVPFVASRLLRPVDDELWAKALLGLILAFVVLTWILDPLMNALLLTTRQGRGLLSTAATRATYGFMVFAAAAVAFAVDGAVNDKGPYLYLAAGLALWAFTIGQAHSVPPERFRVGLGLHAGGVALAVAAVATALLGLEIAGPLSFLLVLTGVGMTWFSALS